MYLSRNVLTQLRTYVRNFKISNFIFNLNSSCTEVELCIWELGTVLFVQYCISISMLLYVTPYVHTYMVNSRMIHSRSR